MSTIRLLRAAIVSCLLLAGLSLAGPSHAGTCGSPVSVYFYQGVAVSGAPNGRVIVPVRTDAGATACTVGPHDAFFVEPGATFAISRLHTTVASGPGFCTSGLGLNVCGTSRLVVGNEAETEIYPIDPTAMGGITTTFHGYGSRSYRTLGS